MAPSTPKLSDSAKNMLRNERRRLAKEQANGEVRAAIEARSYSQRVTHPVPLTPVVRRPRDNRTALAFYKAILPRTSIVLASEGVKAAVRADFSEDVEPGAWTDFKSINLAYPVTDDTDATEAAAVIRGEVYHEGGHCRFTEPAEDMFRRYCEDVSIDQAKRLMVRDLWDKKKKLYHYAWNLAEDQRMEALVTEDSPRKAAYFAPMVIDLVLDWRRRVTTVEEQRRSFDAVMQYFLAEGLIDTLPTFDDHLAKAQRVAGYPLIAWRRYLPTDIRRGLRDEFVDVWGNDLTRQIERLILTYIRATNVERAVDALMELAPLLVQVQARPQQHGPMQNARRPKGQQSQSQQGAAMPDAEDDYEPKQGEGDGSKSEKPGDDSKPGYGKADEANTDSKPADDKSDAKGSGDIAKGDDKGDGYSKGSASHDLDKALEDALQEAQDERNSSEAVRNDVRAFNEALYSGDTYSTLLPYNALPHTIASVIAEAENMAREMVTAFQAVNMERLPTWQEQQTRGILNVARYITRQPGDREYFRSWSDEWAPGRNMAVSVLLDYSGSMASSTNALATVAYAMKAACDELGLPCSVVLWDDDATLLYEGETAAQFVPRISAAGGTDPQAAMDDLCNQRYDRDKHIVLVMTDGLFATGTEWLNTYRTEGTYFVGAIYSSDTNVKVSALEARMATMGFDSYQGMHTLAPLVHLLEQAIIDMAD